MGGMQIKPDILAIMQREGIELRKKGNGFWARCPLHNERTPSFKADPVRQTFRCYGCGAGGDVITFIQALRKLSFKEALTYLGMASGEQYRPNPRETSKRILVRNFKAQCATYSDRLAWELRGHRRIVQCIHTEDDLELRAWAYHEIPVLEYKLDVLCYGTDEAKYHIYKEAPLDGTAI
jgi:hypothetical protein